MVEGRQSSRPSHRTSCGPSLPLTTRGGMNWSSAKPQRGWGAPHVLLDRIGGRDAGAAADHDPGPRGFMVMRRHARHVAAQARHDLAGAAAMPFAFLLLAPPPEP